MIRLLCILWGYLFGLIQTSYFLGKVQGVDIRKHGSGNAGTTNSFRVLGIKVGVITLAVDMLKSIFAVLLGKMIFGPAHPDMMQLLVLYIGVGVILGHNFPFYMKFKGGKGIAATGGAVIAFGYQPMILVSLATFIGIVVFTHYVSLASILMCTSVVIQMIIYGQMGVFAKAPFNLNPSYLPELYLVSIFILCLAVFQHRANIKRLINGNENKFYFKKRSE